MLGQRPSGRSSLGRRSTVSDRVRDALPSFDSGGLPTRRGPLVTHGAINSVMLFVGLRLLLTALVIYAFSASLLLIVAFNLLATAPRIWYHVSDTENAVLELLYGDDPTDGRSTTRRTKRTHRTQTSTSRRTRRSSRSSRDRL